MTLELFEQGPSVYIPVLLISILITAVSYATFPLLFARIRKKGITARKYRLFCYLFNFFVMVFFIALNGSSSGAPYILWTSIFCYSGLKTLDRRKLIADPNAPAQSSDSTLEYTEKFQQPAVAASTPVKPKKSKNRFCKHCGHPIDPATKKCNGCGKQYFRLHISKSDLFFGIIITLALAIAFLSLYRIGQYQQQIAQLNTQISELETELASAKQAASELQDKYKKKFSEAYDLSQENQSLKNQVTNMEQVYDFCNDHVVVVSDDGTRKYHKIQCPYFDDSYFWAYNTEKAVQLGYTPCSFCFSRYFDSLTN